MLIYSNNFTTNCYELLIVDKITILIKANLNCIILYYCNDTINIVILEQTRNIIIFVYYVIIV